MGAKQKPTRPVPNLCTTKSIITMPHDIPTITPAAQYFLLFEHWISYCQKQNVFYNSKNCERKSEMPETIKLLLRQCCQAVPELASRKKYFWQPSCAICNGSKCVFCTVHCIGSSTLRYRCLDLKTINGSKHWLCRCEHSISENHTCHQQHKA